LKRRKTSELRDPVCNLCDLCHETKTVCMMGEGSKDADLVILSDTPSVREDDLGRLLQGRTGKLLEMMLEPFHIKKSDIYITNAVKCITGTKNPPKMSEIRLCRKYLELELEMIQPKLVLTLGNVALRAITDDYRMNISRVRGRIFWDTKFGDTTFHVLPTYHPAAALRDEYYVEIIYDDIEKAAKIIDGKLTEREPVKNYHLVTLENIDQCVEDIQSSKLISVDIETTGLEMFGDDLIRTVGISSAKGNGYCFVLEDEDWCDKFPNPEDVLETLDEILGNPKIAKVGHNFNFDRLFLKQYDLDVRGNIYDTMIMFYILDENYRTKGLKQLTNIYLPEYGGYDDGVDLFGPLDQLWEYNCYDVDVTRRLFWILQRKIKAEGRLKLLKFLMALADTSFTMTNNGLRVHTKRLVAYEKQYIKHKEKLERRLRKKSKAPKDFNFNSAKQLQGLVFNKMKYTPVKLTKAGAPSLDAEALGEMVEGQGGDFLEMLMEYRLTGKILSTYLKGIKKFLKSRYIHPRWNVAKYEAGGTVTGRLSSSDPNINNTPRDGVIKKMFVSRFAGGCMTHVDYSQMELRVLADITGDENMIAMFDQKDTDFHRLTAAQVHGIDESLVTEDQRKFAKSVNFGIAYAMSAYGLAKRINVSQGEASAFIKKWFSRFPGVKQWMKDIKKYIVRHKQSLTPTGRVRHLPNADYNTSRGREDIRQGINFPIQSFASDITSFSMWMLHEYIQREKFRSKLIANIYDAVIIDTHPEEVEEIVEVIKGVLLNPPLEDYFDYKLKVRLDIEIKQGYSWKETETVYE